ncbi:hypothetical protein SLA2020_214840 [Shorea laevis]
MEEWRSKLRNVLNPELLKPLLSGERKEPKFNLCGLEWKQLLLNIKPNFLASKDRSYKPIWCILLISNLALGAYKFAKARKRNSSTAEIKIEKAGQNVPQRWLVFVRFL